MNLKLSIPKVFKPLFKDELKDYRRIIYYGGRGSGKTETIARYCLLKALTIPNINILCIRNLNTDLKYSTYSVIKSLIHILELLDYFTIYNNSFLCNNNSKFLFTGLSNKTMYSIKGKANIDIAWSDEAHYLTQEIYDIFAPSIRNENSQIILTFNPMHKDDFLSKIILNNKDPLTYTKKVNYEDNPYFPNVLNNERLSNLRNYPKEIYEHIWKGNFKNYNQTPVIDILKLQYYDDTLNYYYPKLIISCDTAYSVKSHADYSVLSLFGITKDDKIHFLRMLRGQWEFNVLLNNLKDLYSFAVDKYSSGVDIVIENKASGQSLIQEMERLTNLNIYGITPINDKLTRLTACLNDIYDKLMFPLDNLNPLNIWIQDVINEAKSFRSDLKHSNDDIVDTITQLFNYLEDIVDYTKLVE